MSLSCVLDSFIFRIYRLNGKLIGLKSSRSRRNVLARGQCRSFSNALSYAGPDDEYYESLTKNLPVEVRFTNLKGRTLFARRKINEGETLFSDSPIVSAPMTVKAAPSCSMCLRPLAPTQLIVSNVESRQKAQSIPSQFQEFKTALLNKLRVTKLDLTRDNDNRCFCSPQCCETFHQTFSAGPQYVQQLSNHPKIVNSVGIKDRSVLDLIVRLLVITRGWTQPLPGHTARMHYEDSDPKSMSLSERTQYELLLETVPIAKDRFSALDFLRLRSLIRLNGFSIATFPLSIALTALPSSSKQQWDVQIMRNLDGQVTISALYTFGSLCNHSCTPSVGLQAGLSSTTVDWIALRDIQADEELSFSYVSLDGTSDVLGDEITSTRDPLERKAALLSEYGFQCDCPICVDLPEVRIVR